MNELYKAALEYHKEPVPGKLSVASSKPMVTQRDLSLAYSPGVAAPCLEIAKDPEAAYLYTSKGNTVAVISNGTAVLGLGNLGALASKPVMEGKAALFKKCANIDAYDIEVSTEDPETFINTVKYIASTWGGINLEDIKGPECFIIQEQLQEALNIPVFHDDQQGTAVVVTAALSNALEIQGKSFNNVKVVINGAGAAGIACAKLLLEFGVDRSAITLCDSQGVVHSDRSLSTWKKEFASKTHLRSLEEAIRGADVFIGLSVKGALSKEMVKSMAKNPTIFALANPEPEILPTDVASVRDDAIVATGRSDYPNQVNNVMGFPYIFRGALDARASKITKKMCVAASLSIASIAKEDVPEEVKVLYGDKKFGPQYIMPTPFDRRLLEKVSRAVAEAAKL